ncbi:hypothetical protein [Pontibacter arcticus]|uniref:Uncharacterized protein n=1 Tax=Pontibacter arcticus TaxID=2080288 RepID=A0A364RDV6_9BACT|nr:hypothetical protein [Pontibacter arcticus]RAU82473.1 hypothetical protein DP923_11860 [Pontibacter arcticus]
MKVETIPYKPSFKAFLLYFGLLFSLLSVMIVGFYLALEREKSFTEYLTSFVYLYFLIPLLNAVAFAYSTRRHDYFISEINDPALAASWVVAFLQKEGMRIKSEDGNRTVLESGKTFFRALNNWFGTEMITVSATEHEVIASGNFRYIDLLDTKIKFGNVPFRDQPYKHS